MKVVLPTSDAREAELTGAEAARLYKYYWQLAAPFVAFKLPYARVRADGIYNKAKREFDLFAVLCAKYSIDPHAYLKFFIETEGTASDVAGKLVAYETVRRYAARLSLADKRKKVYASLVDTSRKFAMWCVSVGAPTAKDGMVKAVSEGRLSALYLSGTVNSHFLACVPGIENVFAKMDPISKDEFGHFADMIDIYAAEARDAWKCMKSSSFNPLATADSAIAAKRGEDSLFDSGL